MAAQSWAERTYCGYPSDHPLSNTVLNNYQVCGSELGTEGTVGNSSDAASALWVLYISRNRKFE